MRKSTKAIVTTAVVVSLIGGGSAAFAWWSGTGAGTGTATTTSGAGPSSITVNQTNSAITSLTPGGAASALSGNFTNNNTTTVTVSNVTIALTVTQTPSAATAYPSGCTVADYTVVQPVISPAQSIAGSATSGSWAGSVAMNNRAANQNGCLGATLSFAYSVS